MALHSVTCGWQYRRAHWSRCGDMADRPRGSACIWINIGPSLVPVVRWWVKTGRHGQGVEARVNAMNRRAMAALLGLVLMLHSAGSLALDDAETAMVTVLEYEMTSLGSRETKQERPSTSFCLMRGGFKARQMSPLEGPIG